jgi:hypothetical protein
VENCSAYYKPPSYTLKQKKHSYVKYLSLLKKNNNNNHITIQDRFYSSSNYNLCFTASHETDFGTLFLDLSEHFTGSRVFM